MDSKLLSIIQKLNLDEHEARVYLATLELGGGKAADIADRAQIERTNTYYILKQLSIKGLISLSKQNGVRIFSAVSPKQILYRKEQDLVQFKKALPLLATLEKSNPAKPVVSYFENKRGMAAVLQDIIETMKVIPIENREVLSVLSPDTAFDLLKEAELDAMRRCKEEQIRFRWMAPDTVYAKKFLKVAKEFYYDIRLVPQESYSFKTELDIYANKIAILGVSGSPVGIIIEHKEIAQTHRELFELAWNTRSPGKDA
jgi:sugar-specific transcriptional regulator TrmB